MAPGAMGQDVVGAVLVAAGRGERFGSTDKVVTRLLGRPMLAYVLDAFERSDRVRDVVVVVGEHTRPAVETLIARGRWQKVRTIVTGGARRQDSVMAGVHTLAGDVTMVVVHDAARPLLTPGLLDRCVDAACRDGAAIAAVPVSDTLKRVADGQVVETIEREGLWAAQTPQVVRHAILTAAMRHSELTGHIVTDEAGLCEAIGVPVTIVPSSPTNLKITRAEDVRLAEALLKMRHGGDEPDDPR